MPATGGTLQLSTSINNAGGQIAAQNASGVLQSGGTVSGGTIASSGSGVLHVNAAGTINLNDAGARLALEVTGTTTLAAALTVRGQGNIGTPIISGCNHTLVNNGTIVADGGTLVIAALTAGGGQMPVFARRHPDHGQRRQPHRHEAQRRWCERLQLQHRSTCQ